MIHSAFLGSVLLGLFQAQSGKTVLCDGDLRPDRIHLSGDGKKLAMSGGAAKGGDWKIFDLADGKCAVNGMEGNVRCWGAWAVRLSADNCLMAVGGNYNNFFLVDAKTGKLVWDLTNEGHVGVVESPRNAFNT